MMIEGATAVDIEQLTAESITHITTEVEEPLWKTTIIATTVGAIDGEPPVAVAGSTAAAEVVEKAVVDGATTTINHRLKRAEETVRQRVQVVEAVEVGGVEATNRLHSTEAAVIGTTEVVIITQQVALVTMAVVAADKVTASSATATATISEILYLPQTESNQLLNKQYKVRVSAA